MGSNTSLNAVGGDKQIRSDQEWNPARLLLQVLLLKYNAL